MNTLVEYWWYLNAGMKIIMKDEALVYKVSILIIESYDLQELLSNVGSVKTYQLLYTVNTSVSYDRFNLKKLCFILMSYEKVKLILPVCPNSPNHFLSAFHTFGEMERALPAGPGGLAKLSPVFFQIELNQISVREWRLGLIFLYRCTAEPCLA